MNTRITRRTFLATSVAACLASAGPLWAAEPAIPLVDFHAHPDDHTIDEILAIAAAKGVKLGIVEHAGTKENKYPVLFNDDAALRGWVARLQGKGCYVGVQAECLDWMTCFSKEAVAELDYVLSDALTMHENGKRIELWKPGVEVGDKQAWMDRYTDFNIEVMATEPIDILANPTFLPAAIEKEADALWTEKRMTRIIDAALKYKVAIEISSKYRLPSLPFLKLAKAAGSKFSFGSNGRGNDIAKKDYWLEMIQALELKPSDLFTPAPKGKKPIQVR